MNYYIVENGQQCGPLSLDQLRFKNITPETPIWREGMPQWGKAKDFPELSSIMQGATPPPPNYEQPSAQQSYQQQSYQQPSEPCPDRHLGLSIVATVLTTLCCFPFAIGIVALIYSLNVENKWKRGDYDIAVRNAKNAKGWAIGSIIATIVLYIICIAIYAAVGVALVEYGYDFFDIFDALDYYY